MSESTRPCVLVTRPSHQSSGFIQLLKDAGVKPISLPSIDISFVSADVSAALSSDLVIFTSANAVNGAAHNETLPCNYRGKIAAIGKATASALLDRGIRTDFVPDKAYGSEALLEMLSNDLDLSELKITIVRGDSGREKLHQVLSQSGAQVHYLQVYKRGLPVYTDAHLRSVFETGIPDIVSVTSDLGLRNLLKILPGQLHGSIKTCHLIVNSERCASFARDHGFNAKIVVAKPPGDESQVTEILRLAHHTS